MKDTHTAFSGSIPENYDHYLGPVLFKFTAIDLANRVNDIISTNGTVLEIACGTGISTEYLREALSNDVSIIATDVSVDMLNFAKKNRGSLPKVEYSIADATALSFQNDYFDAVVCQFGVMFFPDKEKGLREMVRVLKPGGVLALNVWDSTEHNSIIAVAHKTISKFFKINPPQFLEIPFGFHDIEVIKKLMHEAGLEQIKSSNVSKTVDNVSAHDIARGLVTGNPTILEIEKNAIADSETIIDSVTEAIEKNYGVGKPKFNLQEIVFIGIKNQKTSN